MSTPEQDKVRDEAEQAKTLTWPAVVQGLGAQLIWATVLVLVTWKALS